MKRRVANLAVLFAMCTLMSWSGVAAQEPEADSAVQALSVFLDCNGRNCDFDHFRREITWVNWVRDRRDSDVHLLVTTQRTGGGGQHYTLDYLGQGVYAGLEKSLSYISDPDDTDAEVRDGLTQTIALGLVQFVETTALAPRLRVVYQAPEVAVVQREEQDPWNLWVFRLSFDGSLEGEELDNRYSISGGASADRVAEDLKVNFDLHGRYSRREIDFEEEGIEVYEDWDYSANLLTVWSLSDHWSAGGTAGANASTRVNRDLALTAGPAIEYNIFPYHESTRRQLTFRYAIEAAAFWYMERTVEGKWSEVLPRHSLVIGAAVQQPWGEINGSLRGTQYLHDLETHSITAFAELEYRLFRGFNFDIDVQVSRVKDQFYLSAAGIDPEDVYLRRRARETNFRYELGIGFSYRFGSKFANVVNPRMEGRGRFFRR
ncbi:MAG: hypothetical protein JSW46_09935 [Gemmatimonadota bacterium]|nr:MAG: hypothetical protein JSW46_09935 [Gemmatimonadota bacterium]